MESSSSIDQLIDPAFVAERGSLELDEIRRRRAACQDAEEALSLHRRLVQGRLDIIQAELYRRSGGAEADVEKLIADLPDILVEHGDRHLGPGRLTSVDSEPALGPGFDDLVDHLDHIVDGAKLCNLVAESEDDLRRMAEELDSIERSISSRRHAL